MVFFPALAQCYMKRITGTDDIESGHFGTLGYVLYNWIGSLCGKDSCSMDEMNLLKKLNFLSDSSISILLTMMIIYLIMVVSAGCSCIEATFRGGQNYLVYAINSYHSRRRRIHHSARHLSDFGGNCSSRYRFFKKIGAKRESGALDCPIVYLYAPNEVLIGFLFSFLGGLVGMSARTDEACTEPAQSGAFSYRRDCWRLWQCHWRLSWCDG